MSAEEPTTKKQKTAAADWIVYYHTGFTGRAQAAELLLEDAGISWERGSMSDLFKASSASMALPAVQQCSSGKFCGQTSALCAFIGQEIGYGPSTGLEIDAMKLAGDIADIWSEGYTKRKAAIDGDKEAALAWIDVDTGRFRRFLVAMEATRNQVRGAETWAFLLGDKPCYVDFLFLNSLITLEYCYGKDRVAAVVNLFPDLVQIQSSLLARPGVAAYLQSSEPVLYDRVSAAGLC